VAVRVGAAPGPPRGVAPGVKNGAPRNDDVDEKAEIDDSADVAESCDAVEFKDKEAEEVAEA